MTQESFLKPNPSPIAFKILICLSILFYTSTPASADLFQVSIISKKPGDLIAAKNCLDYHFCENTKSVFMGDSSEYQFHSRIELPDSRALQTALSDCQLATQNITLIAKNMSTQTQITLDLIDSKESKFKNSYPGIYFKPLRYREMNQNYKNIQKLLNHDQDAEAGKLILETFQIPDLNFKIEFTSRNMGSALAIAHTENDSKRIEIAKHQNACELIRIIRHEFEHVIQLNRTETCKQQGYHHSFEDHFARERSAYLNDYANLPYFCPFDNEVKRLQKNAFQIFYHDYVNEKESFLN